MQSHVRVGSRRGGKEEREVRRPRRLPPHPPLRLNMPLLMLSAPHLPRGSENSLYFILYINIHLDVGLSLSRLTLTHTHRSALEARVFQLDVPSHDGCIVRGQPTPTSARTLHRAQIRYIMPPYIPIVPKYIPSCPHHTGTAALHSGDGSYAPYTSAWTSPGSYRAVHVAPLTCKRYLQGLRCGIQGLRLRVWELGFRG